jgi:hypothetical protein
VAQAWLFGARTDLAVFAGSVLGSGLLAWAAPQLGVAGETPLWAWVVCVLAIDVAHVWATLFRTYLDTGEVRRRPLLLTGVPLLAYAGGVAAHLHAPSLFWRLLAYAALFHFVRQQYGWVALYGRRAGASRLERRLDAAVVYAVTLGPVLWWHARLPRPYWWFVEGDFAPLPGWLAPVALWGQAAGVAVWGAFQLGRLWRSTSARRAGVPGGSAPGGSAHGGRAPGGSAHGGSAQGGSAQGDGVQVGKVVLVAATWGAWVGGIVLARDDFSFTVMNVTLHGVPYLALLWRYARGRAAEAGGGGRLLLRAGLPGFLALLVALAFLEELLWDRLVWHERPMLFGAGGPELPEVLLALVVPLLALPQATHYVLDAFIWRPGSDSRLLTRLGWRAPGVGQVTEPTRGL